jgi:hypothetical protein
VNVFETVPEGDDVKQARSILNALDHRYPLGSSMRWLHLDTHRMPSFSYCRSDETTVSAAKVEQLARACNRAHEAQAAAYAQVFGEAMTAAMINRAIIWTQVVRLWCRMAQTAFRASKDPEQMPGLRIADLGESNLKVPIAKVAAPRFKVQWASPETVAVAA